MVLVRISENFSVLVEICNYGSIKIKKISYIHLLTYLMTIATFTSKPIESLPCIGQNARYQKANISKLSMCSVVIFWGLFWIFTRVYNMISLTQEMHASIMVWQPTMLGHMLIQRGRMAEGLKGLLWKKHCLLWPVLWSVLHTAASHPAQANTEMLSVHWRGFTVTEEISRVDKMQLNLTFTSSQQISFEVLLSQFPLYRLGGDIFTV